MDCEAGNLLVADSRHPLQYFQSKRFHSNPGRDSSVGRALDL